MKVEDFLAAGEKVVIQDGDDSFTDRRPWLSGRARSLKDVSKKDAAALLMKPIATAYPVLPGKTDKARAFIKSLGTTHKKDFAALERKLKTTKEVIFLQPSPQGDVIIDYFESTDPKKALEIMAKLDDKFTMWMKDQIKDFSGFDVSAIAKEPLPEQLLSFGY